jgi:hypothetical protein
LPSDDDAFDLDSKEKKQEYFLKRTTTTTLAPGLLINIIIIFFYVKICRIWREIVLVETLRRHSTKRAGVRLVRRLATIGSNLAAACRRFAKYAFVMKIMIIIIIISLLLLLLFLKNVFVNS